MDRDLSALKNTAKEVQNRVNAFMGRRLDAMDDVVPSFKDALRHALLLGGKRSRPLLVYVTGRALGAEDATLDYAAAGVECIHAYSLVHDDMPEMDNDALRRGQPTVHKKYGQATALLVGDTLQALAFEFLSSPASGIKPENALKLCSVLARGAGYDGMCGGQAMDLYYEGKDITMDTLRELHRRKTGALIRAAVQLGYTVAGLEDPRLCAALDDYAADVGLAFQVWDDVLDVIGDTAVLGKNAGADIALHKSTYPALMGLEKAQELALAARDRAVARLGDIPFDLSLLEDFAFFTVSRDH